MKKIIFLITILFAFSNLEARRLWVLFDSTNSMIEVNGVNKVLVDKNDNVWFTTAGWGNLNEYKVNFYKHKNGQFTVYNPYNSLKGYVNQILDILIDPYGDPWIASQRIGVAKYANKKWLQFLFDTINEYSHNELDFVKEIEIDNENNIWVGTFNGLYKMDLDFNLISPIYKYPLKRNRTMSILSMVFNRDKNKLWFYAVNEALFLSNGNYFTRFDYDTLLNLAGTNLNNFVLDSLGNIWSSADDGIEQFMLLLFNGNSFVKIDSNYTEYAKSKLLPLGVDHSGNVWFSLIKLTINSDRYFSGLVKYDGKTWQLFDTTNTDLPTNTFYSISFDSFNNMWLGTDKGLLVINFGEDGVILDVAEQNTKNSISISPNPATDYIELSASSVILSKAKNPDIYIFDILGMEVTTPSLRDTPPYQGGEKVRIDVSHLSTGVYFVRVGDVVRKFVKM